MLLWLSLLVWTGSCLARDTKMVVGVHRHGARYSYASLERPDDVGQLTLNGHRMAYLLGRFIRQRFPDFFETRMNATETFVYASALPRCRRTAQSVLLGIYDHGSLPDPLPAGSRFTKPEWDGLDVPIDFESALPAAAQPVPIHSFFETENHIFQPHRIEYCPGVTAKLETEDHPGAPAFLAAMNAFLPKLRNPEFDYRKMIDKPALTSLRDYVFADYIHSQRFLGHSLGLSEPDYLHFERMDILNDYMQVFHNPHLSRYMFTEMAKPLIQRLEELQAYLASDPTGGKGLKRMVLFSGHDTNVYLALLAASLVRLDCLTPSGDCTINPRFASIILFEAYQEAGQTFVESTYNGEPLAFCPTPDGRDCSLSQFIARLREISFPDDLETLRERFCRVPSPLPFQLLMMTCFMAAVGLAAAGLGLAVRSRSID